MEAKQSALVTGGSRGIGRAICLALAAQGVNVAVNYAGSAAAAEAVAEECRALGVDAFAIQGNVACEADAQNLIAQTVERFGRIDVLVNNAGITRDNLMMRMSEEDFDAVLATNLKGAFHCMKAACRPMMKQRSGRIVNVSSIVGVRGNAGQANYAASKAGVIGMTKSFAKEVAARGITVNAVAPGFIETDMTKALQKAAADAIMSGIPMKRMGRAEEVAEAAAFFASEAASYVTGQVLCVDGGM